MSAVQPHLQSGPQTNAQFSFANPDQTNPFRPQEVPRAMNPPHLGGQLPSQQQSMLSLYAGSQQLQQPPQTNPQFQQQIPSQQQQQPQGPHSTLGMMPPTPGLVANNGGQPGLPHQAQLQHVQQQQRAMMQRAIGNPQLPNPPGPFAPGGPPPMRRISSQPQPLPQGAPQMPAMGLQGPQQPPNPPHLMVPQNIAGLRQNSLNARILANQSGSQGIPPEMALAMGRHQQQQQQQAMLNGLQPGQLQRNPSQPIGTPHQMGHLPQQQPPQTQQHRTPFTQHPQHQSHAPSPTRPSSHPSQAGTPGGPMGGATQVQRPPQTSPEHAFLQQQPSPQQVPQPQQQPMFPNPGQPHPSRQHQQPPTQFPFLPQDSAEHSASRTQPFHITPAQQLQQLQQAQDSFALPMMPPAQQRPAPSRPEPGPSGSPRPLSRHPQGNPSAARPQQPTGPHMQSILPAGSPHHRRVTSTGAPPVPPELHGMPPVPPQLMRQNPFPPSSILGWGQGLGRLLGFSAAMANEKCDRLKYDHWNKVVTDYFTPQAVWKLTLWKDNERREAKPFEIGPNVIAMLLLVSCQSGVRSMRLALDGARERMIVPGTAAIECPDAQWIWRFYDGHTIILRGTFACQISAFHNTHQSGDQPYYTLKFDSMNFDSNAHDRLISLDAIRGTRALENLQKTPATTTQGSPDGASSASSVGAATAKADEAVERTIEPDPRVMIEHALLPQEPINAFGIPQASMRCLELAESVGQMTELFAYGWTHDLGPQDALTQMAQMIKSQFGQFPLGPGGAPSMPPTEGTQAVSLFGTGGAQPPQPQPQPPPPLATQSQSLQQLSQQQPQQQQQAVPPSTQAGPSSHSPQQQQQPPTPSKGPSQSVSAPAGPATSLKRKAQPEPPEPPNKRMTRRKSKAGGAG